MLPMPSSPLIDRPCLDSPVIDLSQSGTGRERWSDAVYAMDPFIARSFQRLVVVAPHPDDETLGVGGLIASTSERGGRVLVVSLTDGEAAYEHVGLAELRHNELCAAMHRLSLAAPVAIDRWQMPDGGLARREAEIAERLSQIVRPGDFVVGPLDCDGHPDHDAAGAAVLALADDGSIDVASYPVWSWHWQDPSSSVITERGQRVQMTRSALTAKLAAIDMYPSQTAGPGPILPDHFVRRFDQPFEVLIRR